jgi:muramoyltetrapeptide carboxypeptidase
VVAPGSPFDREKLQAALGLLEEQGYRVSVGDHVFEARGYVAGSESARTADLMAAFLNPEIAAVFCCRGGYGSGCLLPWLPFSKLAAHEKPFVGYSDMTFLHLAFQARMGWTTFHGPNMMDLAEDPRLASDLIKALQGEREFAFDLAENQVLSHGIAKGRILGGNLTCLTHLMGTPYFPDFDGAILFIEDCNEQLYRLDRCINQLKLGHVFDGLAGLVLGRFKDCGEAHEIHEMLKHHASPFRFPIVADLPFGHAGDNEPFPLGAPFSLNTYEHSLRPLTPLFSHAI